MKKWAFPVKNINSLRDLAKPKNAFGVDLNPSNNFLWNFYFMLTILLTYLLMPYSVQNKGLILDNSVLSKCSRVYSGLGGRPDRWY